MQVELRVGVLCSDCTNAYLGPDGIYCGVYKDIFEDESIANDCAEFQDIRQNSSTTRIKLERGDMGKRGRGVIYVSLDELADYLHIQERIVGAETDFSREVLCVYVEGDNVPLVVPGESARHLRLKKRLKEKLTHDSAIAF